jgi:Peptidase_C39 like family
MNSALTIATATTAAAALVALAVAVEPARATAKPIGLGANQQAGTFGDPAAAAPFWRLQHSSDCGEMAVADVVGQITGTEPPEWKIALLAKTSSGVAGAGPIYRRRRGTDIRNLPVLLAHYGIQSSLAQSSIGGLEQDLAQGRKVIAAVNAQTIWNDPGDRGTDNHVVVVTGIDPQAGVVHLNDSGIKTGRDERVSLATFEKSWATSQDLAVVTS